jgi:protein tyrosine/serine phosphatase
MAGLEWQSLGRDSSLHIKTIFSADSYNLWVTDLCSLWHEKASRRHIIRRGRENELQIDLEDPNNLRIVLEHLSSSLQSDAVEVDKLKAGQYLEFNVKIQLPKPLPEASWIFKPASCDCDEFRAQVTAPLFEKIRLQEQGEADLILRIKDKDHVIERLMDNLDKASIDLSTVFPALAPHSNARKGISKEETRKFVPALAPFDTEVWRHDVQQGKYYRGHDPVDVNPTPLMGNGGEKEMETQVCMNGTVTIHLA